MKYIHQLPQTILALILLFIYKPESKNKYKDKTVYISDKFKGGISLGEIIIVHRQEPNTIKHEYGHSRQSIYLGWLYLLIVGIPSFTMAIMTNAGILKSENYYKRFPENWADKLGNVKEITK